MRTSHLIFIVAAPSGAGKTSLVRALLEKTPGVSASVSHTTRTPRPGEMEGMHYYFISHDHYHGLREGGAFVEHAQVFDYHYATSRQELERLLQKGDVILDIDWQGAQQVRQAFPNQVVSIFILPPSLQALQHRLENRAQDHPEVIQRRMSLARAEISHYSEFDYLLVNEHFDEALSALQGIIHTERLKLKRQEPLQAGLIKELLTG